MDEQTIIIMQIMDFSQCNHSISITRFLILSLTIYGALERQWQKHQIVNLQNEKNLNEENSPNLSNYIGMASIRNVLRRCIRYDKILGKHSGCYVQGHDNHISNALELS